MIQDSQINRQTIDRLIPLDQQPQSLYLLHSDTGFDFIAKRKRGKHISQKDWTTISTAIDDFNDHFPGTKTRYFNTRREIYLLTKTRRRNDRGRLTKQYEIGIATVGGVTTYIQSNKDQTLADFMDDITDNLTRQHVSPLTLDAATIIKA